MKTKTTKIMRSLHHIILAALCSLSGLAYSGEPWRCFDGGANGAGGGNGAGGPRNGYVFGYGGYTFGYDDLEAHEPIFPSQERIDMNSGYIFGGGFGKYLCLLGGSRFEIEGLHARNDMGRIRSDINDGLGFRNFGFGGQWTTNAFMVNMIKEIPLGSLTGLLGAGVGYAENQISIYEPYDPPTPARGITESDGTIAWQVIAGVDMPVANCLGVFFQYKLLGVGESVFQRTDLVVDSHVTHNLVMGARVSF